MIASKELDAVAGGKCECRRELKIFYVHLRVVNLIV